MWHLSSLLLNVGGAPPHPQYPTIHQWSKWDVRIFAKVGESPSRYRAISYHAIRATWGGAGGLRTVLPLAGYSSSPPVPLAAPAGSQCSWWHLETSTLGSLWLVGRGCTAFERVESLGWPFRRLPLRMVAAFRRSMVVDFLCMLCRPTWGSGRPGGGPWCRTCSSGLSLAARLVSPKAATAAQTRPRTRLGDGMQELS